ncbi:hypothetical protein GCM10023322_37440 [Rugosimonospora acidiphila]|uniref:Uncharacterized protein n=1 Tax=Rugosimonospora acidiphila TaxID=556531 RepID=A0ABP9RWQ8_9ACTN
MVAIQLLLVAWLIWNLWNLFRIATGLRNASWRRPMWWTRVCSISLFAGLASWTWGAFSGGLDVGEACTWNHHQRYDEVYRDAHAEEFQRLFPLHNKCNPDFDLVPAWVNPIVAASAIVLVIAVAVLLWFGWARLTGRLAGRESAGRVAGAAGD